MYSNTDFYKITDDSSQYIPRIQKLNEYITLPVYNVQYTVIICTLYYTYEYSFITVVCMYM